MTVEEAVDRIRQRNSSLRALITPTLEDALRRGRELRDEPRLSILHGVPYSLKDIWDTAGVRTTSGSWRRRERIPETSATIHRALQDAGAVLVGKSNCSDLALSPESDNYICGPTCHPDDPSRTSGGSTGGGAVAVADGMAVFDWGSDFAGSIRLPAAFCGVTGLRLSASHYSAEEHVPTPPQVFLPLNAVGPIARKVAGCRSILAVVAAKLRRIPISAGLFEQSAFRRVALYGPSERFSTGHWPSFVHDAESLFAAASVSTQAAWGLPPPMQVDFAFNHYVASHFDAFAAAGELSLWTGLGAILSATSIARLVGDRRIHPSTAQVLWILGIGHLSIWRSKSAAIERLAAIRRAAQEIWQEGWLICAPTTTYSAPRHGRVLWTPGMMAFTKLGNVIDATCVAIPFGRFENGLPRSLQLLGPPGSEDAVLEIAQRLESLIDGQKGPS